jgi:hypothetical protein
MTDLTTATTPTRLAADLFQMDVPDGWQQGRGAFGGLVLGNLARAIAAFDETDSPAPPRSLRAITAELCGPVLTGLNSIRVERLRTGTGVSTIAARVERDGEVLAHAVGVLGRDRALGTDFRDLERPAMPPWREVELAAARLSFGPSFAQFFEFRPLGARPFSGAAEAVTSGWVRPRDPGPARDAAYVTSLIDAWWPAIFARLTEPRPMATVAFTIDLVEGLDGLDPASPFFYTARSLWSRGGYAVELRQLWGEDGRLVALNHQTFTIIK